METEIGKRVHPETVRRVLHRANFHSRIARRKPHISAVNIKKRIAFAKDHILKDEDWWKRVIFAHESKYNLYVSDGRSTVWRRPNEELRKINVKPTVKHGGASVMVWGYMAANGVGELVFLDKIMDQHVYLNILKDNLKKSAENLGLSGLFQFYHDNDPKHTAHLVKLWLLYNCPKVLHPPPQSPDINPIEHLWAKLETEIRQSPIINKEHLKQRIREEWGKISSDYTRKLVESMPKRLKDVIKAKGGPTRY